MSGVMLRWLAWLWAISARPVRAAEPWRSMSSEDGGVGTSVSIRRCRVSRAGDVRADSSALCSRDFATGRFAAGRLAVFARGVARLALTRGFGLGATRLRVGRLAERAAFRVFLTGFRVVL